MGIRISEMEEATTFGADDYVPIVTNGTNKKALGAKIKDFIAGFFATKNGDNITDDSAFRTAIGINAANTPFVNTGTGMTAEDVQAGIEELNTSKANIDGSNIANPTAFRQNIGINVGALTSANTKVSVISGYFLKIANIIFVDVIFTANQSIGANEYLLSGQPSIGNNNYPIVCALAEGGANSNNLARLYASYIVANGTLTAGKSYHCFGSYTI